MDQFNSQFIVVIGLSGTCFFSKSSLPLRGSSPHITHCSLGQAHSSPQTASRSVQPSLYGSQILCCTMHREWGRKAPTLPLPFGISSPCGEGPKHGHKQHAQKFGKDHTCGSGDILVDRQTQRQTHNTHTQTYSSQYFATAPAGELVTVRNSHSV